MFLVSWFNKQRHHRLASRLAQLTFTLKPGVHFNLGAIQMHLFTDKQIN